MSDATEDLEHEVEASRARLDRTLDSLQARLNVSRLAEDLVGPNAPGPALNAGARRLLDGARENLLPTLLVGAGLGFLLYDALRQEAERRRLRVVPGAPRTYARYADGLERRAADEDEVIARIIATMREEGRITRERYGRAVRTSHAKSHGLAEGTLHVLDGLPPELRQGLFAEPRTYPVIARFSHVPGEYLDDRKVSAPRGLSLKIFGVEGERLPGHEGETTQDFILDTGTTFPAADAKAFLATIGALRRATPAPVAVKQAVSAGARAANAVLNAVGLGSATLDFFGHPPYHPLAEAYYSQTPLRYGAYVAKLAVRPATEGLRALIGRTIDLSGDENALRHAVTDYLTTHPVAYEVAVQLCTDPARMPIEDASREWPEAESPYRPVARLVLPAQDSQGRIGKEEDLAFCPSHTLAAHRPLGSINRARLRAYEAMGTLRRQENGRSTAEPRTVAEI
ncbi:hypothetical protein M446_0738 [Methylobacterium sp. 4-46]|uniref:DUF3618 domain-containing protein n=1 Tax=unclassified Methylobacterium TaxID=2615210 RepID=UPI000152C3F6|nr:MULTISPECIES: DUF3618 domain-containing protein [Methylobacterium]ACA15296.1 hypothetical protein M446_0738 [Methylobacterium sp. 4-46]WFT81022.1 DUF3618 domain-containing protein [Methylobacterium nodulans]